MTTHAPEFKPQSSSDFFEERKGENERFSGAGSNQPNNITQGMIKANMDKVHGMANDQRMNSRKMEQNKGKALKITKGLGSTANFLGGGDYDEAYEKLPKQEKIAFINEEEEKKELTAKDKALVKYNFQDFLKQFGGLTE